MPSYAALLATVYCVPLDMDLLFYEIRRFVSGFVRRDVAGATRGLAVRVARVAAVLHQVMPRFLDGAYDVVAHPHFLPFPLASPAGSFTGFLDCSGTGGGCIGAA